MINKQYVHDQMLKCKTVLGSIMEHQEGSSFEDDPMLAGMLIGFEEEFTILWDRWVLFFSQTEEANRRNKNDNVQPQMEDVTQKEQEGSEVTEL